VNIQLYDIKMIFTILFKVPLNKTFLVLFFLLFFNSISFSQEKNINSQTIKLKDSYRIEKKYSFILSKQDTLLNGPFTLDLRPDITEQFKSKEYRIKEIRIDYANNQKEGVFTVVGNDFKPDFSNISVSEAFINISYKGSYDKTTGKYIKDKPVGKWFFFRINDRNEVLPDTSILISANFNNSGLFRGPFAFNNKEDRIRVTGYFNNQNFFEGDWNVYLNESASFTYHFTEGKLNKITYLTAENSISHIDLTSTKSTGYQAQSYDSTFLEYLIYNLNTNNPDITGHDYQVFTNALNLSFIYFSLKENNLEKYIPGGSNIIYPQIQLPVFDLEPKKKKSLEDSHSRALLLSKSIDSLLNHPGFRTYKNNDKEIAELNAQANILKDRSIILIKTTGIAGKPLVKHVDIYEHLENRIPEISKHESVSFNFNNEKTEATLEPEAPQGKNPFENLSSIISSLENINKSIKDDISNKVKRLQRNKSLIESEEVLTKLSNEISAIVDTLYLPLYRQEIENIYKSSFEDFKSRHINEYSLKSLEERSIAVDTLIECLEKAKSELLRSWELVERAQLVDQAYMEMKLNPYTYEKMNVRVNDKLFKAYNEKIIPFLVSHIMPSESCETFFGRVKNIEVMQYYMLQARKANARKLERKFKANDSAEAIIRKLEIPLNL
jgi:hypothetical protein